MLAIKTFTTSTGEVSIGQLSASDVIYHLTPSAAMTITLPKANAETGRILRLMAGANVYTITVNTQSGDSIAVSGNSSLATSISNTSTPYGSVSLVAVDSTTWQVMEVTGVTADFV